MATSSKLNIGSGPSGLPGWINFDWGILPFLSKHRFLRSIFVSFRLLSPGYACNWPKIDLVDISKGLPLDDKTVKYIYCSHVLEHFERFQAVDILMECRRVLSKSGKLRLVLPDIKLITQLYEKDLVAAKKDKKIRPGLIFSRRLWGFDKDIRPNGFLGRLARSFVRDHQWQYDQSEVVLLLKEAGFENIKILSFRKGEVPDIDKLDLPEHRNHSTYVEC